MNAPDTPRRVSNLPELLQLTDEERQNGLALFAAEAATPAERPQAFEAHQTFEHVAAYGKTVVYTGRGVGRPIPGALPDTRVPLAWQVSLLAGGVTAVLVVFSVLLVRVMDTPDEDRVATMSLPVATDARESKGIETRRDTALAPASSPDVAAVQAAAARPAAVSRARPAAPSAPAPRVAAAPVPRVAAASVPRVAAPKPAPRAESAVLVEPAPIVEAAIAPTPLLQRPEPVTLAAEMRPVPAPPPPAPASASAVSAPPALVPAAEASRVPVPSAPPPEAAIQTVLTRYRTAYRDLDAGAAVAVWPSVDARALRKAFADLEQQNVTFDSCQIEIRNVRAVASCRGLVSYVPRVGNKDLRDDRRQWEFALSKVDDVWLIDKVSAR